MNMRSTTVSLCLLCALVFFQFRVCGGEVSVRTSDALRSALETAEPGTTITLAPREYRGGVYVSGISGKEGAAIIICGGDEDEPPVFTGGNSAIHLSDCNHITIRNITVRGYPGNGINIDDGGTFETPSTQIILENVTIEETGPTGNHDALKMSGVYDFAVRNCTIRGWGGSAIDMVGCHRGVVEGCRLFGAEGFSQATGVQMKGGTTDILVCNSFFDNAGTRAINLGGSTGLKYFRPRVPDYEAKDITIAGNRFVGSGAPVAWVTADGGHVHHNTFVFPHKWILRILQETSSPKFKPCHGGVFENNLVVYDSRVGVFVNVGPGTNPDSFSFRGNAWYQVDGTRKPVLPAKEEDGVYQVDPELKHIHTEKMVITSDDPRLEGIGAGAYKD